MSAATFNQQLKSALSLNLVRVDDPGDGETIEFANKGMAVCKVTTAGAETRLLPTATSPSYPENAMLRIVLTEHGGDLTIDSADTADTVLTFSGAFADFVVVDNAGTREWRRAASVVDTLASSIDLNGQADALILDADADTTISAPTDDQIDFEVGGADVAVLGATSLLLADSVGLALGTGSDIVATWDGTDLDITQATPNSSIKWGVDGEGIDQVWYGDTASNSMTWDQSADDLVFTALAGIVGAASNEVPFTVPAAQETIAAGAGGAISVATHFTSIAADAGGDTATLASGTQKGQIKEILMPTTAGGTVVVTIAAGSGGNTLTLSVAGDFARFYWTGTAWVPIALYNQATGSVATPTWTTV